MDSFPRRNVLRRSSPQFGLMRAVIWLCPGFGGGALLIALHLLKRRSLAVPMDEMLATGIVVILLTAGFAWFDVMVNPKIPKPEGRPAFRESCRAMILYGLGQLIVAPIVLAGTSVAASLLLGMRI